MTNNVKVKKTPIQLDKERNLVFDLNALCILEEKLDGVLDMVDVVGKRSMRTVRTLLWAGLLHEDETLTEEKVGSMLTMLSLEELKHVLDEAIVSSFPIAKNVKPSLTLEEIMTDGTGIGCTT